MIKKCIALMTIAILVISTGINGAEITDSDISDAVEDEIFFDNAVNVNNIDVTTASGVVTLTGVVDNIMAKERAKALAETIKGVRSVVNRITVKPSVTRSDRYIANDVESALLMDRATESYEVDVTVDDGKVTLTGTVESWQEKELSGKVAKSVKGVTALENKIDVDYEDERMDSEIKPEIEKRLRWDTLVDHELITVTVKDGKVTLDGTVGSAVEKTRASSDAWVAGVESVDATNLEVEDWARNEDRRKTKYVIKSDQQIENAVKDAMLYDPRVYSFDIAVDSDSGVVTLRGVVDNIKAKRSAAQDARNTVGVLSVINRIKVRPSTPTDEEIESDITEALIRNPYVEKFEISVAVINGTAYLAGNVDTYYEKGAAEDIASTIYGVSEIKNNIQVDQVGDALSYDPYIYDDYIYGYDWYDYEPGYTFKSDAAIRTEIADELYWSPFVDREEVTIAVDDGIATLTGTVDTWNERVNATEEAYEGGATWVYNDLEIKNNN